MRAETQMTFQDRLRPPKELRVLVTAGASGIGAAIAGLKSPNIWIDGIAIEFIAPDNVPLVRDWRATRLVQGEVIEIHRSIGIVRSLLKDSLIAHRHRASWSNQARYRVGHGSGILDLVGGIIEGPFVGDLQIEPRIQSGRRSGIVSEIIARHQR